MRVFVLLLLINFTALANIQLKVIDEESNSTLSFVKVAAMCLDKTCKDTFQFGLTNKVGIINFKVKFPFIVQINQIGYNPFSDTIKDELGLIIKLKRKEFILDEVVTTGQYTPRSSQKSVYQITTVSAERIQAQSAVNLRDLMSNEMNIKVSQDNVLGSSMTINGLSGQNVKIMIDGVPMIGRLNGNLDLSQINLNNAARVEIIEGPMSAMYGSDALGGVINIITKDYFDDRLFFNGNSYYESVGTYNFDGGIGYNFGKNNILVSGGRNFFKGYSPVDTSRFKQWKPKEQYFSDWQFNTFLDKFTIRYRGSFFYDYILNRGQPIKPYKESAFDDHYRTYRVSNSISAKGEITKERFFEIQGDYSYYERRKNTFLRNLVTLNDVLTTDPSDQDTSIFDSWMLRGSYSHDNAYQKLSYQVGFDLNLHSARGEKIKNIEQNINDYALFASLQYKVLEELILQPAIRAIHNTQYDAPLIPSINLKVDFSNYLTLRASYARGFRAPSIQELHFLFVDINHNIQGNTELKAETSNSFNFGFNLHSEGATHAFKFEPSFFYNDVNDLITLANVNSELYSYINIGNFKSTGFSFNLSYIRNDLSSKIGISWIAKKYKLVDSLEAPKFIFNPEAIVNILWSSNFLDLKLALFYKYNGKQAGFQLINDTDYEEFLIDDYHLADVTISRDFWDGQINLSLGVKNIFDVVNIKQSASQGGVHSAGGDSSPVSYGRILTAGIRLNIK